MGDVLSNNPHETAALKAAIEAVAKETGVKPLFTLVMVLQRE